MVAKSITCTSVSLTTQLIEPTKKLYIIHVEELKSIISLSFIDSRNIYEYAPVIEVMIGNIERKPSKVK